MKLCRCYEKVVMNHAAVDYWKVYSVEFSYSSTRSTYEAADCLLYVFVVFLANNAISYGFYFICTHCFIFAKVPIRYVLSGLKPILWIFLFTFFLHIFTNKEGEVLFQLGWFRYMKRIRAGDIHFYTILRYYFNDDIINVNDDTH